MSILIAVILGAYFWHLQKQDSDKMQEILDTIKSRDMKRKRIWAKIAYDNLTYIRDMLIGLQENLDMIIRLKDEENYFTQSKSYYEGSFNIISKQYLPNIRDALSRIIDLLDDPSLYVDLSKQDIDFDYVFQYVRPDEENLLDRKNHLEQELLDNMKSLIERVNRYRRVYQKSTQLVF